MRKVTNLKVVLFKQKTKQTKNPEQDTYIQFIKNMNTLKSHYLYNLNSSNIYKY